SKVNVEISTLAGSAPFDSKNVSLFREHYMQMSSVATDMFKMNTQTGKKAWFPEILVPANLKGQFPFDIPDAGYGIEGQHNQAVWVDVHIPSGQAPGKYSGKIKVSAADGHVAELNLALEILPLVLPDKATFNIDMMDYGFALRKSFSVKMKSPDEIKR